jgi:hypothetical protein
MSAPGTRKANALWIRADRPITTDVFVKLKSRSLFVALAVATSLAYPGAALGQTCQAPPGTAGIDEYCESIPAAGGVTGPGDKGRTGPGIPAATRKTLLGQGAAGKAVAQLAPVAPHGAGGDKSSSSAGGSSNGGTPVHDQSNGALQAVASAVDTGVGSGPGFTWALLGLTALLGAAAWVRYRSRPSE